MPLLVAAGAALAGRLVELRGVSALFTGETDAAGMLVVGDAGVGKFRLVTTAAVDRDVLVASGYTVKHYFRPTDR